VTREDCITRSFITCTSHRVLESKGGQINKDDMAGACSMHRKVK
jgi:hypothetical protein